MATCGSPGVGRRLVESLVRRRPRRVAGFMVSVACGFYNRNGRLWVANQRALGCGSPRLESPRHDLHLGQVKISNEVVEGRMAKSPEF
ncbi:hypothetical protein NL676_034896 [Syzygium grande]|nr:hypothetical protein NL676_034896 [Syzygium grande]